MIQLTVSTSYTVDPKNLAQALWACSPEAFAAVLQGLATLRSEDKDADRKVDLIASSLVRTGELFRRGNSGRSLLQYLVQRADFWQQFNEYQRGEKAVQGGEGTDLKT